MQFKLARAGTRAAAMLYSGGTLAHVLRLAFDFPMQAMPFLIDWIIAVVGTFGAIGLTLASRYIAYRGSWEKGVHALIVLHLVASALMHGWAILTASHEMFAVFRVEYSYFAVVYFAFFAWRSWTVRFEPECHAGVT